MASPSQTATPVRTWWVRPERRASMSSASASSRGLPNISAPRTTAVSAPITTAGPAGDPAWASGCSSRAAAERVSRRWTGAARRRRLDLLIRGGHKRVDQRFALFRLGRYDEALEVALETDESELGRCAFPVTLEDGSSGKVVMDWSD